MSTQETIYDTMNDSDLSEDEFPISWTNLKTNGGTVQQEQASRAKSGRNTPIIMENNSTSGGVDTTTKMLLSLKNGAPRMK